MQTHGEFDFNFNRGSGTKGDSSETGHEGEEQSPTNGGHNYTFADYEWDGDYHPLLEDDFHAPPPSPRRLRKTCRPPTEPLQQYEEVLARERGGRGVKKNIKKKRGQWSSEALREAFYALDGGYKMKEVSNNFGIPRSTLREHYFGKRKSRKIRPKCVLTMAEERQLVQYLEEMVRISCPLNSTQLKQKVAEMTQTRMTHSEMASLENPG